MNWWIEWYWAVPIIAAEIIVLYYVNKFIERKLNEQEKQEHDQPLP
jgi:hypothetical protein